VVRPIGIYGPGDTRFLTMFRGIARRTFPMLGGGEVFYHLTFVSDLIEGFRLAGTRAEASGRTYIIAGPRYTTMNELAAMIATELGVPARCACRLAVLTAGALCRPSDSVALEPPRAAARHFHTKTARSTPPRAGRAGLRADRSDMEGISPRSGAASRNAVSDTSAPRRLRVLHICDHLGWPGSRMHGVKRLFAWMLPRFDASRYHVSLISLRKKDLSEDTLEQLGIDVRYLSRGKFDPATLTDLLKLIDREQADVLHMHGYGATTFGRAAAAIRRLPTVLHEHANHTDTPLFQKAADKALAPFTDIAIAVSKSTADFTTRARLVPAARTHVVYLGAPLDEFAKPRSSEETRAPASNWVCRAMPRSSAR
jgi:hypothetical protein